MKVRATLTLAFAAMLISGAAHAADDRIIYGPLTMCEKVLIANCKLIDPAGEGSSKYDTCIADGFAKCNGGSSLGGTNAGNLAPKSTAGYQAAPQPAPKSGASNFGRPSSRFSTGR